MDCRETQTLLTAFHDGELPAADRARVEEHLRGCPECGAHAGRPGAGRSGGRRPRSGTRVLGPVQRPRDGSRRAGSGRPEGDGPAAESAAGCGSSSVISSPPPPQRRWSWWSSGTAGCIPVSRSRPPAVSEPAAPAPMEQRKTDAEPGSRAAKKAEGTEVARRVPPPAIARERSAAVAWEERDRTAAPAGSAPATVPDGTPPKMRSERKIAPGATAPTAEQRAAATGTSAAGMRIAEEATPDGHGRPGAGAGRDATGSVAPAGGSPPVIRCGGDAPGDASRAEEDGRSGSPEDGTGSFRQGEVDPGDEDRKGDVHRLAVRAGAHARRRGTDPGSGSRTAGVSRGGSPRTLPGEGSRLPGRTARPPGALSRSRRGHRGGRPNVPAESSAGTVPPAAADGAEASDGGPGYPLALRCLPIGPGHRSGSERARGGVHSWVLGDESAGSRPCHPGSVMPVEGTATSDDPELRRAELAGRRGPGLRQIHRSSVAGSMLPSQEPETPTPITFACVVFPRIVADSTMTASAVRTWTSRWHRLTSTRNRSRVHGSLSTSPHAPGSPTIGHPALVNLLRT